MHRHGLVEIEVGALLLPGEPMREIVKRQHHVRLFDVARAQDLVPGPVLADGKFFGRDIAHGAKLLVEEAVLLHEHAAPGILFQIHFFGHFAHFFALGLLKLHAGQLCAVQGELDAPFCHIVRQPVVVDVVLVFVGGGDAQQHIPIFHGRCMCFGSPRTAATSKATL